MENQLGPTKEFTLENIISAAVQVPGVKVNRKKFLTEIFATENVDINTIIEYGPIEANCSRETLLRIANKLILKRTSESSIASFAAGLPGGWAIAATIPADVLQFFGMSFRLAQELSYLYGAQDLWQNGEVDDERVRNQLIMYCGVMFGVSGAAAGVRILSTQIAKTTLKKLPQQALTKTFWYPIVKQIGKAVSIKVTKSTVAKGISKAIPVVGGVISGSLNFASMLPMAKRLLETLDNAYFNYTEENIEFDINVLNEIDEYQEVKQNNKANTIQNKISKKFQNVSNNVSEFFAKNLQSKNDTENDIISNIERLAKLKDNGIISQEEFDTKKSELLSKL